MDRAKVTKIFVFKSALAQLIIREDFTALISVKAS
jgi:hypothetical protein